MGGVGTKKNLLRKRRVQCAPSFPLIVVVDSCALLVQKEDCKPILTFHVKTFGGHNLLGHVSGPCEGASGVSSYCLAVLRARPCPSYLCIRVAQVYRRCSLSASALYMCVPELHTEIQSTRVKT